MAVNLFERPVANRYQFQYFTPNFEAWANLAGQYQQEYNQTEALMNKMPQYLKYSKSDREGAQEYQDLILGLRDKLGDSFKTGQSEGRMAMQAAQYAIMEQWGSNGLASNLESRLANQGEIEKQLQQTFKDNPNELPYALAMSRQGIDPLRNSAGAFQDVGRTAMPAPMEAEAFSKWMAENEKGIAETILSDKIIRRHLTGNQYESVQDIIVETRGKDRDRIFQILASMVPDEFKAWYQFKHNAMEYNSGGTYKAGDQTTLFNVKTITDENGQTAQTVTPNLDSELGRLLWAKATGSAYIKHERTKAKITDYGAKKAGELAAEFPYVNPNVAGPSIATKAGGVFHDVKTIGQMRDVVSTVDSQVAKHKNDIIAIASQMGRDPAEMATFLDNMEAQAMNPNGYSDEQIINSFKARGFNEESARALIASIHERQKVQAITDQMYAIAEKKTGISRQGTEALLDHLQGTINVDGQDVPLATFARNVAVGEIRSMDDIAAARINPLAPASFEYKDQFGQIHRVTGQQAQLANQIIQDPRVIKYKQQQERLSNAAGIGDIFSGEYISTTTIPALIPYRDASGNVTMAASKAYTEAYRKLREDPSILANYVWYDPKDPTSAKTITLAEQLPDIAKDSNGNVLWDKVKVYDMNTAIPGFGYGSYVGYEKSDGSIGGTYIKAPKEPAELLVTNGYHFDELDPQTYARVMSDELYNQQLLEANRMFANYNGKDPIYYPILGLDGKPEGRLVFSGQGANPVTKTATGGETYPYVRFEYVVGDGVNNTTNTTNVDEGREFFYRFNTPSQ